MSDELEKAAPAKPIPEPALRRLPAYLHLLKRVRERGREVISTSHFARTLKLDPTQVRKDLSYTGAVGKPKVGYQVDELIQAIESFLGWNNTTDAFLIGAGSLGTALLGYERLTEYGLNIVAAFDIDRDKVGKRVHDREVFHISRLRALAPRMHVHIALLAVPTRVAQEVVEQLEEAGMKAIWNFVPTHLDAPEDMIVVDVDLYASLAVLTRRLERALNSPKMGE